MGSGGYVWPAIESLDPLRAVLGEAGINMAAFLTEAHGKVENFPVSAGVGDALNEIFVTWADLARHRVGRLRAEEGRDRSQLRAEYQLAGPASTRSRPELTARGVISGRPDHHNDGTWGAWMTVGDEVRAAGPPAGARTGGQARTWSAGQMTCRAPA